MNQASKQPKDAILPLGAVVSEIGRSKGNIAMSRLVDLGQVLFTYNVCLSYLIFFVRLADALIVVLVVI